MKDLVLPDFDKTLTMSRKEIREYISHVETSLMEMEQVEIPLKHYFSKAVYAREVSLKKGTMAVGEIQKFMSLSILSSGEVTILSIDGVKRVKAPYTFVASPGAKRLVYAHEDSTWTSVHGTEETDLEKIEQEVIAKTYDDVVELSQTEIIQIGGL